MLLEPGICVPAITYGPFDRYGSHVRWSADRVGSRVRFVSCVASCEAIARTRFFVLNGPQAHQRRERALAMVVSSRLHWPGCVDRVRKGANRDEDLTTNCGCPIYPLSDRDERASSMVKYQQETAEIACGYADAGESIDDQAIDLTTFDLFQEAL